MQEAINILNKHSDDLFRYLKCICNHIEKRKSISIEKNDDEVVFFFEIDGKYITNDSKKADILVFYYNYTTNKDRLIIIELKGINVKKALRQLDETILHPAINRFWSKFNGIKSAGIVYYGGSPGNYKPIKKEIENRHNIRIIVKRGPSVKLQSFFVN